MKKSYVITTIDTEYPFGTVATKYHVQLKRSDNKDVLQEHDTPFGDLEGSFDNIDPGSYVFGAIMMDDMGAKVGPEVESAVFVVEPEPPVSLPQPALIEMAPDAPAAHSRRTKA